MIVYIYHASVLRMCGVGTANQLYVFAFQPERVPHLPSGLSGRAATWALLTSTHVFEKLAPLLVSKNLAMLNSFTKFTSHNYIH